MRKVYKIINIVFIFIKFCYYKIYCKFFSIINDNLWIICERGTDARDNGYFLYKYIKENEKDINIKYVIDRKSADYKKVSALGDTIQYRSKEHYISFITAGMLISTHDMGFSPEMSLFSRLNNKKLLKVKGKKVYIQHGINKDDIYAPRCDLILTGGYEEYKATVKKYPNFNVQYTGIARFDNLPQTHKKTRKILFMPTFRKWLNYLSDDKYKKTEYYLNLQGLINNEKLYSMLKKYNYEIIFYPHYEIQKRLNLFSTKYENIKIASFENYDVQNLLIESDLLITDFSSVYFDFAFMYKPVIYFQFDNEKYRKEHYKEGYFNYKKDGFGDAVDNLDDLLNILETKLKSECKVDEKYKNRIDAFFKYRDKENCKRNLIEIKKLM